MRNRTIIIVSAFLITVCAGIVSARGVLSNTYSSGLSIQIASEDLQVLNVIPAIAYQPGTTNPVTSGISINVNEFPAMPVNVTAGFSFAPHQGFIAVNRVILTVVYAGGAGGYDGFQVSLNHHTRTTIAGTSVQNTAVGLLTNQDIRDGSNVIDIGLSPTSPTQLASTFIYQVRVTVEYSFLG